jgi:VWFA-related protein
MYRMRRLMAASAWVSLAIVAQLFAAPAASQDSNELQIPQGPHLIPRSKSDREADFQAEHHIILNVRVQDDAGKAVVGLQPSDFTLLDNSQEMRIASLREAKGVGAPVPPRVMFLLDGVNDTPRELRAIYDGIERFLSSGAGPTELPISLALFTDLRIIADAPTQDRDRLSSQLASLSPLAHPTGCEMGVAQPAGFGQTRLNWPSYVNCLNRKFEVSVNQLARLAEEEANKPGRLILVWLGAGWPRLDGVEFAPDTLALKQNFFDYLVELSDALRLGQVTLDEVTAAGPMHKLDSQKSLQRVEDVTSEKQATATSLSLQALAVAGGGVVLDGPGELAGKIGACMADAESYYVLAFDSHPAENPGEYHSIEIKVNKPGLTVRTTRYYYGEP